MRKDDLPGVGFTDNELILIEEAVRRAVAQRGMADVDRGAIVDAVVDAARRGTRTMFGLVRVGLRVREVRP